MNFRTVAKFVCVTIACVVLHACFNWGICENIIPPDPCPNDVTKAGEPCPFPGGSLHSSCDDLSTCSGFTAYSAETKNNSTEKNTSSETWTSSVSYEPPDGGYVCASCTACIQDLQTLLCKSRTEDRKAFGKLYTQNSCN